VSTNRILAAALTAALSCSPLAAHAGHQKAGAAQKSTITGELVDMRCYLDTGEKGPDHQQCASLCAKDGIPVGLLTSEGKVYTLVVPPSALASVMALQAEVTGTVHGEAIVPETLKVKKGDAWQPVKLPEHM
jgi:hypothetical protein